MPIQNFIQIAQKLRRLERIMGGLAADAEQKAVLFDGSCDDGYADRLEIAPLGDRFDSMMDRQRLGRLLLQLRNSRHDHLEPELFSNASWDILLTLFVEGEAGKKALSITTICNDAHIPVATGERWLSLLSEQALIRTEEAAADFQACTISLSPQGVAAMEQYIDSAGAAIYAMFVDMQVCAELDGQLAR